MLLGNTIPMIYVPKTCSHISDHQVSALEIYGFRIIFTFSFDNIYDFPCFDNVCNVVKTTSGFQK